MAIKGLSKLVAADYSYTGGEVQYSSGSVNECMISYSAEIETTEPAFLYVDNRPKEKDGGGFSSGSLTLGVDGMTPEMTESFFSVKKVEGADGTYTELVYDDGTKGKDKGIGVIEYGQRNNVDFYRAVLLPRVSFNIPADSATTKGDSIEWQTPEISGTIMRSDENNDSVNYPWKKTAEFKTEAEALAYLKQKLSITE